MSKNLKSSIVVACFFLATAVTGFAQTKPGCEPSSCGPDNTKKEEAVAITKLRSDLQTVIGAMKKSSIKFDSEITNFKIGKGSTDDESLLFIAQATTFVRAELVAKIPANKINQELKKYKATPSQTKQKMVASLKNEIQLLSKQINSL